MGKLINLKTNNFEHLVKNHPCLGGEANAKHGRVHLPVSASCNIQCKFCKRGFNKYENRPGVASGLVEPKDAINYVNKALVLCPEITVVGIAGPGDTLASPAALETFSFVHEKHPELILCMSTNGLMLSEKAEEIVASGVQTLTVTVNSINPEIQKNIISYIIYEGKVIEGIEAAKILIEKQLEGIEKIAKLGVYVKINTVLIPGLNDIDVENIARVTSEKGASIMNILPLIPQNEMANFKAPDCNELDSARRVAEKYLPVFRHCQHCRADACGIPGSGKDLAGALYSNAMETFSHG